jgi:hypothetical protein
MKNSDKIFTSDQVDRLNLENKRLRRENWWLKAFAICVIIVQLYDLLHKTLSK